MPQQPRTGPQSGPQERSGRQEGLPGPQHAPGARPGPGPQHAPAQRARSPRGSILEAIFTFAAYLVFGILAGAIGTVAHRARVDVAGVVLWLGLIGALACILLIAVGLRLYLRERLPVTAFAIGVVATVFVFTLGGAEHSVLVPASSSGFGVGEIWMLGSAVCAFVPVIWPSLRGSGPRRADTLSERAAPRANEFGDHQ